jgi:Tfp pilus assembly protein PilO
MEEESEKVPIYKRITAVVAEYPRVFMVIAAIVVIMILVYYYSGIQYLSGKLEKIEDLETKMNDLIKSIYDKQKQNMDLLS